MKFGLLLSVLFSTMVFAGVANAQRETTGRTRLIFGKDAGVWRAPAVSNKDSKIGGLEIDADGRWIKLSRDSVATTPISAGTTVRLRIASANNRGKLIVGVDNANIGTRAQTSGRVYVATQVGVYLVPCDGSGEARTGTGTLTLTGVISDGIPAWTTEKSWSGSCRMLLVHLDDGREVGGKIRFR